MTIRRRRLSRDQLRSRRLPRREARARPGGRVHLAQGHEPEGRRRRDPAGRLRARRLPAHRRHRAVLADHAGRARASPSAGGPVLGICNGFQVLLEAGLLPGAMLRNRDLEVPLRAGASCASSRPTRRSRVARRKGRCCRCRSRTAKATTSRRPSVDRASSRRTGASFSATATPRGEIDRRGQPERLGQRHRRHLQRGAQRRRPDAAPRARAASRRSAAPTASCCSNPWSARSRTKALRTA